MQFEPLYAVVLVVDATFRIFAEISRLFLVENVEGEAALRVVGFSKTIFTNRCVLRQ